MYPVLSTNFGIARLRSGSVAELVTTAREVDTLRTHIVGRLLVSHYKRLREGGGVVTAR